MTFACLGPDPKIGPPDFEMPAGATDTHAHVIGLPPTYPFVAERAYTPPEAPVAAYRAMHAALGIERGVIVTPSCHGTDNRITLEAIAAYGPNARGIAVVEESVSDQELEALNAGGVRGLRLNVLFGGGVVLQAIRSLGPRARELGWHVQLLLDVSSGLVEIADEIRGLGVPVVVDHMGHPPIGQGLDAPGFQLLLDMVREGLVWIKLSGCDRISAQHPEYRDAIPRAQMLIEAAPEHMVWGTDWPHVSKAENMPNDTILLNRLGDYAPDADVRRRILVDNPARLYGF
ncbi:MAG: amidohydrolase family protein [Pseudomonadota bacterium]